MISFQKQDGKSHNSMDEMMDNSDPDFQPPQESLALPTAEGSSDLALVNLAREGDEGAFEELFNRHKRRVSLIAGRFFRQREQIEEVLQESFAKAYFALSDFSNTQDSSFASWLARITFNACYDELRRMKRRPESSLTDVSDEESSWLKEHLFVSATGGDIESAAITRDLATKLLSRLGAEDRLVLVMLEAEGMTVAEIARLMNWSVPKVKVRAHRARAHLRKALKRFL
jgi:RNA polymerase sigma-70 factor (ECF subfamily)